MVSAHSLWALEDLLADKRYPSVRRYLRRVYPDPMTGSAEWGLVRGPNGGITGVQSRSTAQPLKKANFPKEYEAFAGAATYRDWVFAFAPPAGAPPGAPGAPGAPKQGGSSSVLTPLIPSAPAGTGPSGNVACCSDRLDGAPRQRLELERAA